MPSIRAAPNEESDGRQFEVQAMLAPDAKGCTPSTDAVKMTGNIIWVAATDALLAEVRLYERLFSPVQPDSGELLDELNSKSLETCAAYVEPSLASAAAGGAGFQLKRHGYLVVDVKATGPGGIRVFNRAAGMRDGWDKN